jgi:hypothetical protein
MLRVRVPFFAYYLNTINVPKGSIWYFHIFKEKGIIIELTFICDYRLIGKSFTFQVKIVGSSPTNHITNIGEMAEWLKAADCKFVEIIST